MQVLNLNKDGRPKDGMFIGRGSLLGNPFYLINESERGVVCDKYYGRIIYKIIRDDEDYIKALRKIYDNDETAKLMCFCSPKRCHGDEIKKIINKIKQYDNFDLGIETIRQKYQNTINPLTDNITHINVYSKGKTLIGRMLSNLYSTNIETNDGVFNSLENYWYWLKTGCKHDFLKTLSPFEAKSKGRKLPKITIDSNEFNERILNITKLKIEQNKSIYNELINSSLPLEHYYFYGNEINCKITRVETMDFQLRHIEQYRENIHRTRIMK